MTLQNRSSTDTIQNSPINTKNLFNAHIPRGNSACAAKRGVASCRDMLTWQGPSRIRQERKLHSMLNGASSHKNVWHLSINPVFRKWIQNNENQYFSPSHWAQGSIPIRDMENSQSNPYYSHIANLSESPVNLQRDIVIFCNSNTPSWYISSIEDHNIPMLPMRFGCLIPRRLSHAPDIAIMTHTIIK